MLVIKVVEALEAAVRQRITGAEEWVFCRLLAPTFSGILGARGNT